MGLINMLKSGIGKGVAGGIAGGIYGSGDGMDGALGGAAGGAAAASLGIPFARGMLKKRGGVKGLAGWGINSLSRGEAALGRMGGGLGRAYQKAMPYSRRTAMAGGLGKAEAFIGRNAAITNKVGGAAMAVLGVGASAHIGSSMLSSNRRK